MSPSPNNGITDTPSNHSVEQTVEKLKNILQSKGVTLFALKNMSAKLNMQNVVNILKRSLTEGNFLLKATISMFFRSLFNRIIGIK